jgi:hypothetical protein
MNYKTLNNVVGWLVFAVAAFVYAKTVEPTASFWDCGEFIATSYKLQVPHPPGAPLFLLVGRLFSLMAGDDVTQVAYWINMVSALSSAFTILFLFWSITMLAKKWVVGEEKEVTDFGDALAILGSGAIGALAFTFSDSFWFSAVEAEVYALSSLFTAFVVWAMLRWEAEKDEQYADRWLLLIAYGMGLSIGVHLLNLVTIPALALIYYFKKFKGEVKATKLIITVAISFVILGGILVGVIPGLPSIAAKFEILFVNSFGLPFGSGIIFFCALFIGGLVYGVLYSIKKANYVLNISLLGFIFILIGYCTYGIIVIRSNYNPPIDENNPENILSFVSYLKREQYGDRPLLYGPLFTAEVIKQEKGDPVYIKTEKGYEIVDYKIENTYDPKHEILFPRIYSNRSDHVEAYKNWVKIPANGKRPSFGANIEFYLKCQLGFFYWRYFLWNFVGRESDIQDAGVVWGYEDKSKLPTALATNKARNNFYALPLLLGLIGFIFHTLRRKNDAIVVGLLFVFTGLAIITYLNTPPVEPRERDYAYVGSYYTFCMWIGLGVLALVDIFKKALKNQTVSAGASIAVAAVVPLIMAKEGWDDHDRSNRYHSVDSAKNLLNSCAPNAIIFTGGDNDTFPLWYVQEVEGFRTDVRVCNLSLLGTDWYIDQMKRKAYDSEPLPITLSYENFVQGKNDYVPFVEKANLKNGIDVFRYIQAVERNDQQLKVPTQSGSVLTILPTKTLILTYDSATVAAQFEKEGAIGEVEEQYFDGTTVQKRKRKESIDKRVSWNLGKSALFKNDLLVLDILATNAAQGWKRPIYFSTTLGGSSMMNLQEYMRLEGLAYRFTPIKVQGAREGIVNTDLMYANMMPVDLGGKGDNDKHGFFWRSMQDTTVYYDDNYRKFPLNARKSYYRLAAELFNKGDKERAKKVIDHCLNILPDKVIPYDFYIPQFIPLLIRTGEETKALQIAETMANRADEELEYHFKQRKSAQAMEVQMNLGILQQIYMSLRQEGKTEEAAKYEKIFSKYYQMAG